jgi:hypothetical protein
MQHLIGARHRDDKSQSHLIIVFFDPEFFLPYSAFVMNFLLLFVWARVSSSQKDFSFFFPLGLMHYGNHTGVVFSFLRHLDGME